MFLEDILPHSLCWAPVAAELNSEFVGKDAAETYDTIWPQAKREAESRVDNLEMCPWVVFSILQKFSQSHCSISDS